MYRICDERTILVRVKGQYMIIRAFVEELLGKYIVEQLVRYAKQMFRQVELGQTNDKEYLSFSGAYLRPRHYLNNDEVTKSLAMMCHQVENMQILSFTLLGNNPAMSSSSHAMNKPTRNCSRDFTI
jgi:hypothetical protein